MHSLGSPDLSSRVGYAASMPSPSREFSAGEVNATASRWLEGLSVFAILVIALNGAKGVISSRFAVSTLSIRRCRSIGRRPRLQLHRILLPHCRRAIYTNLTNIEQREPGEAYLHPQYIHILGEVRFQAAMND